MAKRLNFAVKPMNPRLDFKFAPTTAGQAKAVVAGIDGNLGPREARMKPPNDNFDVVELVVWSIEPY